MIHFCGSCVGRMFISGLGVFLIMHTVYKVGSGGSQVEYNPLKLSVHGIDFSVRRSTEGVVGRQIFIIISE